MNQSLSAAPKKQRQSNVELLRLVAMFLIVLTHANIFSLGRPKGAVFDADFEWNTLRFTVQSFSYIGVNLFILISGYFAIKPKFRAVSTFLFQILFFSLFCLACLWLYGLVWGPQLVKPSMWGNAFMILTKYNWFIAAYLLLMVFAPALNALCETASRTRLGFVILALFAASTYLGWMTHYCKEFNDGYSFVSLVLLYLIGRYLRLHRHWHFHRPRWQDAALFLLYVLVNTALAVYRRNNPYRMSLFALNNPLQIYGTVCFFLFFIKINLQSSVVNSLAHGTFGIFLLQMHPQIMPLFRKAVKYLFANNGHVLFSVQALGLVLLFCLLGILIDRLRQPVWALIDQPLQNLYSKVKDRLLRCRSPRDLCRPKKLE